MADDTDAGSEYGWAGIEIRCPSCRKSSSIPLPPPEVFDCPRCRCELAALARIRGDAAILLRRARADLMRGASEAALANASASWDLHHSRDAAQIAFIAATLGCEVAEGVAWLRAARSLATLR